MKIFDNISKIYNKIFPMTFDGGVKELAAIALVAAIVAVFMLNSA